MPARATRRRHAAAAVAALLGGLAAAAIPARADEAAAERGRVLAYRLCAHCHLGDGQGEKQGPESIPGFRAVAARPDQTVEGVVRWIRSKPKMMPDHRVSIEEAYDLAEFILSLKTGK